MRSRIASLVWSALNFCHSASLEWATMQVSTYTVPWRPGAGTKRSWVAVIMVCRYSVSFLKTSMNSTMPRLPTLNAPFSSRTRGSPSE